VDTARVRSGVTESLIVGVPVERFTGSTSFGMIHVLRGGPSGVTASGSQAVKAVDLVAGNAVGAGEFGWSLG
jgi:hypothetical protein